MRHVLACSLVFAAPLIAIAADGDLDASFGSGGKVRLPQAGGYHGTWMPMDVAVQSTGKIIISGWNDQGPTVCFVLRLNADGTLDTNFGNGGYVSYLNCKYTAVAARGNDTIVTGGYGVGYSVTPGFVSQFTPAGVLDSSFNSGNVDLLPTGADTAVVVNRIVLDNAGNVVATGAYTESTNNVDFYLARVTADGSAQTSKHYNTYFSGSSTPNVDIAYDLALAADGSYFIAGTTKSSAGDLNCALSHNYYNATFDAILTDNTFNGGASSLVLAKDYGDTNDDYCFALTLQPHDTMVLGGQSSLAAWQDATFTTQGADGLPGTRTDYKLIYDQINGPFNGDINTVKRVVVEPYDHRALLVGSGPNHTNLPSQSYDIGVARFSDPSTPDTSFGSGGFALYDIGSTKTQPNLNMATSAVLWHDRLIIVGTAQDSAGGTDIVALRLKPFDGIFKDGFEG